MSIKTQNKLLRWLWPARLRTQIALTGGLMLMLTSGVLTSYLTAQRIDDELQTSTTQALVLAKNLAISASTPMLTGRYSQIEEMLVLQSSFPGILNIMIANAQGKEIMSVAPGEDDRPRVRYGEAMITLPASAESNVEISDDKMILWYPVKGGAVIGWLKIDYSLEPLRATQAHTLQQGLIISVLAIVCSTGLFLFILASPMRAIREAAEFARQLNQHRGETFATDHSARELAQLGEALNEASLSLHQQEKNLIAANTELRNEEEKFRAVSDSANEAIVTSDEHGKIVYLNLAAEITFGYSTAEATGQPLTLFIPEKLHPAHQAIFQQVTLADEAHSIGKTVELTGVKKNGAEFPLEISLASWNTTGKRFFTSVMRDISRRRRGEEAAQHLAAIVESSNDPIISETLGGIVTSWNTAAARLYGYTAAEMINQSSKLIVPPDRVIEKKEFLDRIRQGEHIARHETMRVKKGGELVEVAITVSPLRDSSDHIVGTSTIVRDITERRIAEARIRELTLIDELTGLHNRRGFFTLAEPLLALNRRSQQGLLLLYADMDGFKHINDSLGHAEGDRALKDIAQILRTTFRDSDIISRIGGDEFAIIANEHMAETQAATVIRLQENLSRFNQTSARPYTLAMSVGTFYQDPVGASSLDKILAIADTEMYRVKNQRRVRQKG